MKSVSYYIIGFATAAMLGVGITGVILSSMKWFIPLLISGIVSFLFAVVVFVTNNIED